MSDEQFERFYWPTFKGLVETLIDQGLIPMPLFEGDYTPRLKYWPSCRPARWPATSTRSTARSSRRSSATGCASGATSRPRLLCTGTPQQVKDDVKELIDLFR